MNTEQSQHDLGEFMCSQFGEKYLHAVNRNSFINTGSEAIYKSYFGDRLGEQDSLHIFVGTDSGLLPHYIQKMGPARGARYLFIELPAVIEKLNQSALLEGLSSKIQLVTKDTWLETAEENNLVEYVFIDKAYLHQSLAAADAHLPEYMPFSLEVQDEFTRRCLEIEHGQFGQSFMNKVMSNILEDRTPFDSVFSDRPFEGYTAVLAAGGPSLDETIPWIIEHRTDIVLIAVSRICRRLQQVGLEPDIIVSIDPTHMSFEVSKEMFSFSDYSLYISGDHVCEEVMGQWPGRAVYLGKQFPWESSANVENTPVFGPSVTNSALMSAIVMGFDQIIFAGVDLCFTPDGHSHAKGSDERATNARVGNIGTYVKTNEGHKADTTYTFARAIDSIGQQAKLARSYDCICINPSIQSARIDAVDYIPSEDIVIKPLPKAAKSILDKLVPLETREQRLQSYGVVEKELARMKYCLDKIHAIASEALSAHRKLFNPETAHEKYKKQIEKLEKQLDSNFEEESTFIKKYGVAEFVKLSRPDADVEWTDEETDITGQGYYKAYKNSVDLLLNRIIAVEKRLQCRLEEEKDSPDFPLMEQQWREDNQPGRVQIWKNKSPVAYEKLKEKYNTEIQQLERDFTCILTAENTEHKALTEYESRLEPIRAKAIIQFQQQDITSLKEMLKGLANDSRPEAAQYRAIIEGYTAELEQRDADALKAYQEVPAGLLLEDALKRIAFITLGHQDLDNASLALDCLSAISPSYLPQYADIMRIMGDVAKAAELYTLYLDHSPDDLAIAIRLGRLYQDSGIQDTALQIFDYVLKKDPNNQAALQLRHQLENSA